MEKRVCKKCNKPLPSGYKHQKCERCRGEQVRNIKNGLKTVGEFAVLAFAVTIAKGKISFKK